ncbi:MAG: aftD [Ilumatobacteraceae bacterium]|nr:aftD [Ilumatobacteraceae bacterium]
MWLSSAAITGLVLLQAPGRIVPETKLDVLLDPVTYLGRALTAWDPSAGFGRVQNQAVGYLFPMGAFTTIGHELAVPPWLVQRLWISLVLVVSLWGAHRVARAVGVGSAGGRIVAAWAYALAPATLSVAAFQSAGQLPYALAPWVLVPLLTAPAGASPRRTAARSALWIAAMGGVNGASAFAVLPLVVIWFTTRAPGPARRRLFGWWVAGAVAATLWWIIPLLVSVRYGLRFTDFTEQSSLTTWTESGTEVLRGTGNWLSFIQTDAGPWLPGGWALSADRLAIAGTTGLAALGLAGIARRDAPGRAWLVPSLVLGAVAMGIGYAGAWGGPFDGTVQQLLDGVLVPFRNVHKFAAVVRLPLAIGLGHLVTVGSAATLRRGSTSDRRPRAGERLGPAWRSATVPALALVLIGLAVAPAARGQLTAPGSFVDVPAAWRDAGAWLDAHDEGGRTLLLPGSAFGEYRWGRPLDEPISSIQGSDWAVRDLIPLGGNGSTRLLDAVDTALQRDALPPGFVTALQRSGVRHLLVRNDLDPVRSGGPSPASVRRLLATAPELEVVASFGPVETETGGDHRLSAAPGTAATEAFRTVDIYEVPDPVDRATAYPAAEAAVTSGGPEAVLDLEPELTEGRAVVLALDDGARTLPDPLLVATDTARRRDVLFGSIRDNATYTLTPDEVSPLSGTTPVDRWPTGSPEGLTSARVDGAAALTDSRRPRQSLRPEQQPFHAFDGDPATAWGPAKGNAGEWIQADLDQPVDVRSVTVRIPETTGKHIGRVRVVTDQGTVEGTIGPDGSVTVDLPAGETETIRVVIDEVIGAKPVARVGISEIEIDGVEIRRPLIVPSPADGRDGHGGADVVSLSRDRFDRFSLLRRDEQAELDREFRWGGAAEAGLHGTATAAPGDELDALLATAVPSAGPADGAIEVTATSQQRRLPSFAPTAAVDGDPLTAWLSAPEVTPPAITLRWDGPVPVDTLDVAVLGGVADPVDRVIVTAGATSYERPLDASGRVSIPSTTTDQITVAFPPAVTDPAATRQVAVAEISVPALLGRTASVPDREAPVTLGCGDGPPVSLDGRTIATRASATVGSLLDGAPIGWTACDPVALRPGTHRVTATGGALLTSTLVIEPADGVPAPPEARTVRAGSWGSESRTIELGAGDAAIVATTENLNDGWIATLDGEQLTPIRVDGWRQGWKVPAGSAGTLELRYRPAGLQRAGLALGLLALALLVGAALVRARRRSLLPLGERAWPTPVVWALVVLAGVALGGPWVLVAAPLALLPPRSRRLPVVAAAATAGAGLITFIGAGADVGDTTGTFSGPAQALAVTAVVAVALSLLPDRAARSGSAEQGPVEPEPEAAS